MKKYKFTNLKLVKCFSFIFFLQCNAIYSQYIVIDSLFSEIEHETIYGLLQLDNEHLIILCNKGVLISKNDTLKKNIYPYPISSHFSLNNKLFISSFNGQIFEIRNLENIVEIFNFSNLLIKTFIVTQSNDVWVLGDNRILYYYDSQIKSLLEIEHNVTGLIKFINNDLFFSTKNGVYKIESHKSPKIINKKTIYSIYNSDQEIIVFYDKKSKSKFFKYDIQEETKISIDLPILLQNEKVNFYFADGKIELISTNKLYKLNHNNKWQQLYSSIYDINSIIKKDNNLYLGTNGNGIVKLQLKEKKKISFQGKEVELNKSYIIDHLFFKKNESTLLQKSFLTVEKIYNILNENQNITILIEGHTSRASSKSKAYKLSFLRAKNVKQALIELGINNTRIEIDGLGDQSPIPNVHPDSDLNKRVEITFK